ncbi:hypothetical protein [Chromatium okenii]|uniref:hypothetical protein n=1 Tax=Chromatium okenii TaxID=61644 RepID=UPI001F5BEA9E|nr:hypothetical protein [Chromatium okenii]
MVTQSHSSARKPDSATAMRILIADIRAAIPLDAPPALECSGDCQQCALKLLEFLALELQSWEQRLAQNERPTLAELSQLARTARAAQAAWQHQYPV